MDSNLGSADPTTTSETEASSLSGVGSVARHTAGPWVAVERGDANRMAVIGVGAKYALAIVQSDECGDLKANAARIVACVNACEGLSNEQVADFTRWAREYRIQRDELAAALRAAEPYVDQRAAATDDPKPREVHAAIIKALKSVTP